MMPYKGDILKFQNIHSMKVTYFTNNPLTFKYTDDELEIAINGIIEQIEDDSFCFNALCDTLMVKAQNENKIDNAPNTVYLSNNLDAKEYERVSIILWKKIWAHELCLNFHSNEPNFNNYSFIILKRNE